MTRLLHRPLKAFAIYSLLILLISIPAYFLVVDYIWLEELDEQNWLAVQHTKRKLQSLELSSEDLKKMDDIWGTLQPGASIVPCDTTVSKEDSVYEVIRPNEYDLDNGVDRFRGLRSFLTVNGQPYLITIETNVEEADETLWAIALVTFFFFLMLLVGFVILNNRIARSTWRPFHHTLAALRTFDLHQDKSIAFVETDIIEFQELHTSLTNLISRNIATFQQQKSFTENASHELQTPIALLRSKLDLLVQEKEVSPAMAEIVSSIEAPLSRLSRINKNLLLLAKVENQQYEALESLDVNACLENTLSLFEDYATDRDLTISRSQDRAFSIEANPFLFETLLHNLLSNAIRYTPAGGQISIAIRDRQLVFSNSGSKSLHSENLFRRFSRTNEEVVGSGLGLAIVKEITNRYGWDIHYAFQDGRHVFSVAC